MSETAYRPVRHPAFSAGVLGPRSKGVTSVTRCIIAAVLFVAFAWAAQPASAQPLVNAPPAPSLFRVGKTGIHCYKAPCPWRGIIPLDEEGVAARWPIWSDDQPPALRGSKAQRQRIVSAWADDECLIVEGTFIEATLRVRRIHGPC